MKPIRATGRPLFQAIIFPGGLGGCPPIGQCNLGGFLLMDRNTNLVQKEHRNELG